MCGIAGIISKNPSLVSPNRMASMTNSLAHRGQDGEAQWMNPAGTIILGHRRLAIIDLTTTGAQPMHYLQRYTIVHNGEIYNYKEIKATLIEKGYSFQSTSDTEVILAAYDHYKYRCVDHFDGMFAFAIWDEKEKTLFAARDRFGEKPFYYFLNDEEFTWASEPKAFWAAGIEKTRDESMLLNFLALGWLQDPIDPARNFFTPLKTLPRAHYLLFHSETRHLTVHNYWDLDKQDTRTRISEQQWIEDFTAQLSLSVSRRLRSDVPIGTSLSGGLDSSSIVAILQKNLRQNNVHKAFTCVLPGFAKDESAQARIVADHFNLQSFTVAPSGHEFANGLDQLLYHQDEPIGSAGVFLQYKVMQLAREENTRVLLDGQGADETLSGYSKYIHWWIQELLGKAKFSRAFRELNQFKTNQPAFEWTWKNAIAAFLPAQAANRLEKRTVKSLKQNSEIDAGYIENHFDRQSIFKPLVTQLNDLLYFNTMQFGLEELLRYADRNSMAFGREIRLPFLSHTLVELLFKAPSEVKMQNGFGKYLLRKSMSPHLPESIVWRKGKTGFEAPQQDWMQLPVMKERIIESRKKLINAGILNKTVFDKPIRALPAYAADNFDWRYLIAAKTMF